MASLLQTEAITRAQLITVLETVITLDLTRGTDSFTSSTMITFDCRQPGASTFVDFAGVELTRIELNGLPVAADTWADGRIVLDRLGEHNELRIDGVMAYSSSGEGMCRHVDPADGRTYLYAMSFLDAAPRWYACFDQPDLKSRYVLEVTAPQDWTVHGNGPATSTEPGRWTIRPTAPLSTYFVTLVAGPYASVYAEHDQIPLGLHVRASLGDQLRDQAADILTVTRQCLDYFHATFGRRYPFGEYHQAFVPDFNAGAMENPGCVTFRDSYVFRGAATQAERSVRAGTIAHEMAHMWFGDLVTMRWWDDLWLNESFAEYLAHLATAAVTDYPAWTDFGISRKAWGMIADQSPSTHPVAGNGSVDAASALAQFDGISYAKGAAVLSQLNAYLGDDVFFTGLRRYFDTHAYANATFADLLAAWTGVADGAVDVPGWAEAWLQTSGIDTLTVGADPATGGYLLRREPSGTTAVGPLRPHALAVAALGPDGRELGRTTLRLVGDTEPIPLADSAVAPSAVLIPDPADQAWVRVRPSGGWSELPPISAILDPLTRTVCYRGLADATRHAELDPALTLRTLLDAAAGEPDLELLRSNLQLCSDQLVAGFCATERRSERRAQVASVVRQILADADPGSDRQLIAFRVALRVVDEPALLRGWIDGVGLPPGIELDPELRWAAVCRWVVRGSAAGSEVDELIEQALADDRSGAGQVHAARARALTWTESAKRAALAIVLEPSALSAYEVYATAEGLFHPEQEELTAGLIQPYFDRIDDTATFRSGWALSRTALNAFPVASGRSQTLVTAGQVLERGDLDPAIRRSLVDATDQLGRAVAARERFPG